MGNLVYAVALNLIQNKSATENVARPFASTQTILNNSSVSFLVFCFIAGSLIVLIVFVSAALTLKIRGRTVLEE